MSTDHAGIIQYSENRFAEHVFSLAITIIIMGSCTQPKFNLSDSLISLTITQTYILPTDLLGVYIASITSMSDADAVGVVGLYNNKTSSEVAATSLIVGANNYY